MITMLIVRRFAHTLRFIAAYTAANVQAAMEYRLSFLLQVISMAANDSIWLYFWWSYFQAYPLSHGWQLTDIVVIWTVSACGYGISTCVFGNAINLATLIMTSGLDAYLGMPRNVLLHVCVSKTDPMAWGDVVFAVGAFLIFLRPNPLAFALFVVLALIAALIFTSFAVILCSLAFFLGNTEGLASQLMGALITFSTYPMNLFGGLVRILLFSAIPAGFISFVPLELLHHFSWQLFLALLGFMILILAFATGLFQLGLRRYESGNLLGMQV
jgi:ABC-2 type transport system permease protein